jgi:hypothetical protein
MATLEELQEQLAALKERYSAVIEGSYSAEESIATIAVNMQAQLDDAQEAASSAGIYASAAETSAAVAAAAGAAAGAEAGASEAQTKYDAIFTEEHTWGETQTFYSLNVTKKADFSNLTARDLTGQKGEFYSLHTTDMRVEGQFAMTTLRLGTLDSGARFDVDNASDDIYVDIIGYSYSGNSTSRKDATLRTYSAALEHLSAGFIHKVYTDVLKFDYSSNTVNMEVDGMTGDTAKLRITSSIPLTSGVVLTCYSAALNHCHVGDLSIGTITLTSDELAQLKALINQ